MIRKLRIENFKSILDLTLDLGRVTVLIGENGSGKSNILEGIAFAAAAVQNKLDNEFLASRGMRVPAPRFMRSSFAASNQAQPATERVKGSSGNQGLDDGEVIRLTVMEEYKTEFTTSFTIRADQSLSYPKWTFMVEQFQPKSIADDELRRFIQFLEESSAQADSDKKKVAALVVAHLFSLRTGALREFLIFSPENAALRNFQAEGQILPLGSRGEGLFAHLKSLSAPAHQERLDKIKELLALIDWFEDFNIPGDLGVGERNIRIQDRHLTHDILFGQESANEGFLFVLFYSALLVSPETPSFFSIDNIETALNPKLCIALLRQLVLLSKQYNKQIIITTHNPAVLDGLDLMDDDQRLLVVDRNMDGHTRVRRVEAPKTVKGQPPLALSEAFMRGYIGGLPNNF